MHYVYFLQSTKSRWIYIGRTDNLERRLAEHNDGKTTSTHDKGPWELIYYEAFKDEHDAVSRERKLKAYGSGLGRLKQRLKNSLGTWQ